MELTISPIDVFKAINERNQCDRKQIATFVNAAAAEASDLADIWNHIASQLLADQPVDKNVLHELKVHRFLPRNNSNAALVSEFYHQASSVLGHRSSAWLNKLCHHLGTIMAHRQVAIEEFNDLYDDMYSALYASPEKATDKRDALLDTVNHLRKEAAALVVLSKAIESGARKN